MKISSRYNFWAGQAFAQTTHGHARSHFPIDVSSHLHHRYLDEDEEDEAQAVEGADKAVAPWGVAAAVASNWITGAATFVSKSLHW